MEHRPVAKSKLIPAQAFERERAALIALPAQLPPPYQVHERGTDQYGYAAFDGNYYWVPGTSRQDVKILEYSQRLKIYQGRQCLVEYTLPADGTHNQLITPKGMPPPDRQPKDRKQPTAEEEKHLRALSPIVDRYLNLVLPSTGDIRRHHFIRELFALSRRLPAALFLQTVERALHYGIHDRQTLHRIARLLLSQGQLPLFAAEVDESFLQRQAYQQGRLTEAPDFSLYDQMLEDQDDQDDEDDQNQGRHG